MIAQVYQASMTTLHGAAQTALSRIAPGKRVMGLDLGTKTIGIATSDLTLRIATPRQTLQRKKFGDDAKALLELATQEQIGLLVLGMPLNMDGSEGPRAQSTRAFQRNLAKLTDLPIVFWDERLSTVAVTRTMLEADLSRAKRAEHVDKLAAAYILQSFLDART
jgi:putative Holliday junction resolvase